MEHLAEQPPVQMPFSLRRKSAWCVRCGGNWGRDYGHAYTGNRGNPGYG
jgi:hypothetical protein